MSRCLQINHIIRGSVFDITLNNKVDLTGRCEAILEEIVTFVFAKSNTRILVQFNYSFCQFFNSDVAMLLIELSTAMQSIVIMTSVKS